MISKLASYITLAALTYWVWTGPYADMKNETYEERLQINAADMARCIRSKEYVSGATGGSTYKPEEACARRYNLYFEAGQWHSYADSRPSTSGNS